MRFNHMPEKEYLLRELLAYQYAGAALYADDGELQDNRQLPFIDFLTDDPEDIKLKMIQRGLNTLKGSLHHEQR